MALDLTPDEIIKLLKLEANATCGFCVKPTRALRDRRWWSARTVRRPPPARHDALFHDDAGSAVKLTASRTTSSITTISVTRSSF